MSLLDDARANRIAARFGRTVAIEWIQPREPDGGWTSYADFERIYGGFADLNLSAWVGLLAPANTPPEIVEKLNHAIVEVAQDPAVRARLEPLGRIVTSTPDQFEAHIKKETSVLAGVIRDANIKAN